MDNAHRVLKDTRKHLFDATVEGYCMVFRRKSKLYELKVVRQHTPPDILQVEHFGTQRVFSDAINDNDVLKSLRENVYGRSKLRKYPIDYRIVDYEHDEYIYVVISCEEKVIEKWAEQRDFDVPIDPKQAILYAKRFCEEFMLAQRTHLQTPQHAPNPKDYDRGEDDPLYQKDLEDYHFIVNDNQNFATGNTMDYEAEEEEEQEEKSALLNEPLPPGFGYVDGQPFQLVPAQKWENIHIEYEPVLHNVNFNIYKEPVNTRTRHPVPSAISHVLYLRVLYEILTDDAELDGANWKIEEMLSDKQNPLFKFFALHQQEMLPLTQREFHRFKCVAFRWGSKGSNTRFLDTLRNYYGEQIAFYFAFLTHYTVWLYPLAIIGGIWWAIEMAAFDIGSTSGDLIAVMVIIMWSTLMIENWYRREWKLRLRWGMMAYQHVEVPRATFRGKYVLSTVNGLRMETYKSKLFYWLRRFASICISFVCVLMVVVATVWIWSWQGEYTNLEHKNGIEEYFPVAIGMVNSAQILLFNTLYTRLAKVLNEWEGHRLEEEYYNQLVLKRISFIVINSFYSLFYIAFVDDREEYQDDRVRLEALRMQLIVLFLMALLYQNTLEIFCPVCCPRLVTACGNCCRCDPKQKRKHTTHAQMERDTKELIAANNATQKELNIPAGDDDDHADDSDGKDKQKQKSSSMPPLQDWNIRDIVHQSTLSPSPDVLDNTAEIVVLHGYVTLFIVVFPLMPLLGVVNNFVELFVDKYNLQHTQRPMPTAAGGLGVWSTVLTVFAIVAIYSNLAIITFRTQVVVEFLMDCEAFFANIDAIYWTNEDMAENLTIFYFVSTTLFVFIMGGIRMCIPPITSETAEDLARQERCQRNLLRIARNTKAESMNE